MSFETLLAEFQRQEVADAAALGLSVEAYRAKCVADDEALEEARRQKVVTDKRARQLAPMVRHMSDAGFSAVVENRLRPTAALSFVQKWLRSEKRPALCILTGGTGSGKTLAAGWGFARSADAEYVHARELGARYMPYSHDEARGVTPLRLRAPLLVLDDVGTERWTRDGKAPADDRFTEALSMLFETRQSGEDTPWIICTNKLQDEFIAAYCKDPRDMSRLMSMAAFCKTGAEDLRRA